MRKVRDNEDIGRTTSSVTSQEQQSKSFMLGGGKRFVNLTLPDVSLQGKQAYKKQSYCVICFRNFTNFFRQHHCRVCSNAVCNQCSKSMINKERACDLCIMQCSNPHEEKKKKQILSTLETLCAYLIYRRNLKMAQFQALKSGSGEDNEALLKQIGSQEKQIKELQNQNDKLKEQKQIFEIQLQKIRQANAQIQSSITQIEKDIGTDGLGDYQ